MLNLVLEHKPTLLFYVFGYDLAHSYYYRPAYQLYLPKM